MGATFSIADLIPEPLTFRDSGPGGTGEAYTVLTPDLFSPEDYAEFARLEEEIRLLQRERMPADGSAVSELDRLTAKILAVLIPDLPDARRKKIPIAYRLRFLTWWREQQPEPEAPAGKAAERRQQTPRGTSRSSSRPTRSARAK